MNVCLWVFLSEINQCTSDPPFCGGNEVCVDVLGGAECRCEEGYERNTTDSGHCSGIAKTLFALLQRASSLHFI